MEYDKQRLIIVSNRAPISVTEGGGQLKTKRALGGLATALARVWDRPQSLWVGWSGLGRSFSMAEFESLELGHKLALINLESALYHRYYDRFANGSLWPVFHGFIPREMYNPEDAAATAAVTERFARCVERVTGEDDLIWVHDFHLVFLPAALREHGLRNRLGFFLHIPFPVPKLFRTLPDHRQIAQSFLRCDVLGFQTEADAERFRSYLAEEGLSAAGVDIRAFPIGIDYQLYRQAPESATARAVRATIEHQYAGRTVLFSASRLDYTKGILHQLRAIDELFARTGTRPELVYKLVVAPSREDLTEYQEVKRQASELVAGINRRHGTPAWQPVDFEYCGFGLDELAAWYARADLMLATSLVDGMNLMAKEYVAAHRRAGRLVLGRGAGAAEQMREAVIVDPRDTAAMAAAIEQTLAMPDAERRRRFAALRRGVRRHDVVAWADSFIERLVP